MNNRSGGNQTRLAVMASIVMGVLILIAVLVARERQGFVPIGTSLGRAPDDSHIDFVPPQSDSARVRALVAQARPTSTPVVEGSFDVGRAQIIEDVIFHLERVEVTNKRLRVTYAMKPFELPEPFFRSLFNRKDATVMGIGKPSVTFLDGQTIVSDESFADESSETITFFNENSTPASGRVVTVNMGSGIISAPELAGSVTIELPTQYGDFEPGQEVKTEAYLVVEDARYAVSLERLKFARLKHRVILTPVNHDAKRTELIFGGNKSEDRPGIDVQGAFLTVVPSDSLNFYRKAITFREELDSPLIESMEFDFAGSISPTATSLTFSAQGGGRLRGPFIFENVQLIPELP